MSSESPMAPSEPQWPPTPPPLLSLSAAAAIVEEQARTILAGIPPGIESRGLSEAAGRVLGSGLIAPRDQPPFPRVTRDGFAVRASDLATGAPFRVAGRLRAGDPDELVLRPGEAMEIMTGCALPYGADAVLMVEQAQAQPADPGAAGADAANSATPQSILPRPGSVLRPGDNVVPQGSEARRGDLLLRPGTRLHPKEIALAASCGFRSLQVYRQPKVAILSTGDELREPLRDTSAIPGLQAEPESAIERCQIYDSNSQALAALVRQAHAIPLRQAAVADRLDDIAEEIRKGLEAAPLTLATGGVSMGRYDLVEEALAGFGAEFFFTGVRIQPGKPAVFGRVPAADGRPDRYFFALPGNPISAMVTFRLFVAPLLAALGGERDWQPRLALARLEGEVHPKPGLTRFVPGFLDSCFLDSKRRNPTVSPVPSRGSGDLAAHARANCDILVPEDSESLAAGEPVRVLLR